MKTKRRQKIGKAVVVVAAVKASDAVNSFETANLQFYSGNPQLVLLGV